MINYVTNYNISGSVTSTNVQGDLNQVNNNIVVTSREDWSTLFDSVYQLNQGSEGAGRAQLTDSLGKIQYLPEAATEEEATEWFEENSRNMADALDDMFNGKKYQPGRYVQPVAAKCRSEPFPPPMSRNW